jgi:hypothetical protein
LKTALVGERRPLTPDPSPASGRGENESAKPKDLFGSPIPTDLFGNEIRKQTKRKKSS